MTPLEVTAQKNDACLVVTLKGSIDSSNATQLKDALNALPREQIEKCTLDFHHVSFLTSAGLRVLLVLRQELDKEKIALCLVNLNEALQDVFSVTGLDKLFTIGNR